MSWIFLHLSARMRLIKSFNSVICTLLAVVLFSLTISVTMASQKNYTSGQEYSISKKGTASANSDNQLPYEERETEKDDELQDNFSLICLIYEPVFFSPIGDQDECCDNGQEPVDAITDIPLYLSIRALLI
jgi:hypothetical protein